MLLGEFTDTNRTTIIMVDDIQIPIFKEIPFYVTEFETFRLYVFPNNDVNYSVKI